MPACGRAVFEAPPPPGSHASCVATRLGVAAVDVAAGHVLVGEFQDDEVCDKDLRSDVKGMSKG